MTKLIDSLISSQIHKPSEKVQAFAYALHKAIVRVLNATEKTRCIVDIDHLDEAVLDELAVEWRAVNYSQDLPIETKRNILKATLSVYSTAGTAYSVRKYIQSVYSDSQIEEWYTYEGDPGHFRVDIFDTYSAEKVARISDSIKQIGRYSAVLDAINFFGGESEADMLALAGTIDYAVSYTSTVY